MVSKELLQTYREWKRSFLQNLTESVSTPFESSKEQALEEEAELFRRLIQQASQEL